MFAKVAVMAAVVVAVVSSSGAVTAQPQPMDVVEMLQKPGALRHRHRHHGHHSSHHHGGCGGAVGKSGDFDFYVFQQSWSAEFCHGKNFPGCVSPTSFMQTNFTIHGLWPQYTTKRDGHGWPQCCQSSYGARLNATVEHELKDQLDKYWPVEQGGDKLWQHEWSKHGTCSGMSPTKYLQSALMVDQRIGTPPLVQQNIGGEVKTQDLLDYYNQMAQANTPKSSSSNGNSGDDADAADGSSKSYVALSCRGGYLSDVTTCYNAKLEQIPCLASLRRSCNDETVKIASYNH